MLRTLYEPTMLVTMCVIAQVASIPEWTQMASLPFAFAVGAFLIWSMVNLLNSMIKSRDASTETTIAALRGQVISLREDAASIRKFQDEKLTQLIERDSAALEKTAEASIASVHAWNEVHSDFRDLITELRIRPCIAKRDQMT